MPKLQIEIDVGFHNLLEHFPAYDYRKPFQPERLDMRRRDNIVGHWQRAVDVYWAIEKCIKTGGHGISLGSAGVPAPGCISVDVRTGLPAHYPLDSPLCERAIVGGDIRLDAGETQAYVMRHDVLCDDVHPCFGLGVFQDRAFDLVLANHVIEHIAWPLEQTLREWARLLRPGGIMALVVPEHNPPHLDVLKVDPDHKHAWTHQEFKRIASTVDVLECVEHAEQLNWHSFASVWRKK